MKKVYFLAVFYIIITSLIFGKWNFSGELSFGGEAALKEYRDIYGNSFNEQDYFGEGELFLNFNQENKNISFNIWTNVDEYYNEREMRLNYNIDNSFLGNLNLGIMAGDMDDITENDDDSNNYEGNIYSTYYFNDNSYLIMDGDIYFYKYKKYNPDLQNYYNSSFSTTMVINDFDFNINVKNHDYEEGNVPDDFEYNFSAGYNLYKKDYIINSYISLSKKDYLHSTEDYSNYNNYSIQLRSGYSFMDGLVLYYLGEYSLEEADFKINSYNQWNSGIEMNIFENPIVISAIYGQKRYKKESESRTSYDNYNIDLNWSYWLEKFSIYISNLFELQKIKDISTTEYPEAKNSNYFNSSNILLSYNFSRKFAANLEGFFEIAKYYIEDEMNSNYKQYNSSIGFTYNFYYKYILKLDLEYDVVRYETYKENNENRFGISTSVSYSF